MVSRTEGKHELKNHRNSLCTVTSYKF